MCIPVYASSKEGKEEKIIRKEKLTRLTANSSLYGFTVETNGCISTGFGSLVICFYLIFSFNSMISISSSISEFALGIFSINIGLAILMCIRQGGANFIRCKILISAVRSI